MKTKHAFIAAHASEHAIRFMCRVLGVANSWFHARRRAAPKRAERAARRDRVGSEIREIFEQSKRCYGAPRIHAELKARGFRTSKRTVAKLMRENGIRPPRGRRQVPITTDSRHSHAIVPNLLDRNFEAATPDAVWLADISYIPTDEGWLYLTAVKDLATMEIVGWSMSERLKSVLCEDALKMAIRYRRLPLGLIHHSDRGVQGEFNRSSQHSGIGGCYDGTQTAVGSVWTEQVAFARSTGLGTALGACSVLGSDCDGAFERGRGPRCRCIPSGRLEVVPEVGRHATITFIAIGQAAVRTLPVFRGT